jgi:DHA1 family tetracycline resistance protein-like MFS transporter
VSNENKISENPEKKASKAALIAVFLTVFIDLVGFGIIIPVLPQCASDYGASPQMVGLLVMSYSLMQFFLTPFWGRLSDKVGRRPIMLLSLAASAIGYIIWGLAGSLPMLFLSRIVAGAGNANIAVAQAYVSDVTKAEDRAAGMGLIGAAFGLGFTLGPAIGGGLSTFGFQAIGFGAAACSALAFLLACFRLPEPEKRTQAGHERFSMDPNFYLKTLFDPKLSTSLLIFFLATFAFANMEATLALLAKDWYKFGKADISWLFTYVGFVMVFVQGGLIRRLSKKMPEKPLISAGAVFVIAGLLCTALLHSVTGLYIAMTLLAIGTSIINPSNQSMTSKLADPEKVGGVLGVGQSLSTLGRVLGPLVGGTAFQVLGAEYPYYVGAGVMVVVLLLSFGLPRYIASNDEKTASEPARAGT